MLGSVFVCFFKTTLWVVSRLTVKYLYNRKFAFEMSRVEWDFNFKQ